MHNVKEVETLLRQAWAMTTETPPPTKRPKHNDCKDNATCGSSDKSSNRYLAGSRLALWLLQSGRPQEADEILRTLGFVGRLATPLWQLSAKANKRNDVDDDYDAIVTPASKVAVPLPPCRIYNDFLSQSDLERLRSVFGNRQSQYWTQHNYNVEPPSPYFSHVLDLQDNHKSTGSNTHHHWFKSLVYRIREVIADTWQPLVRTARYAEIWAHHRPPVTGHQFHFDTDNEGQDAVCRHPTITTVLYLYDCPTGGPTLVTNQRVSSPRPADRAWAVHAVAGRLAAMDGRLLHAVLPGQCPQMNSDGDVGGHRVSLMIAFWRRIRVRDERTQGAARPWPGREDWAQALQNAPLDKDDAPEQVPSRSKHNTVTPLAPPTLSPVWYDLDGQPWKGGLAEYDGFFQGM
jgi:hypothetical protein